MLNVVDEFSPRINDFCVMFVLRIFDLKRRQASVRIGLANEDREGFTLMSQNNKIKLFCHFIKK